MKKNYREELIILMKKNKIENLVNTANYEYFDNETINYIINLNLVGVQLKTLIYLVGLGVFKDINEKEHFKIIRLVKKVKNEDEIVELYNTIKKQFYSEDIIKVLKKNKTK